MKSYFVRFMMTFFLMIFSFQSFAMTTKGNQIINDEGQPVELKGANWFGFNNQSTMVDGLWGGPDSISFDFATVVHRLQLLGFNAVRLPFSFKDLYGTNPRNYAQQCKVASLSDIQASVTNPSINPGDKTISPLGSPASRKEGMCNDYLPNDSTLNRFLWVVDFFAKNGFYVLIDNHLREDQTAIENKDKWVQDWVKLATEISKNPEASKKVMIDILNEPDNFGIRWEASGDKPGLSDLYLSAMDAIYKVNPHFLFFIEGTGQGGINANWGDGFATDPQAISQYGLSNPNPFFQALMTKPYVNQVVLSPHIYPPSVTFTPQNSEGAGLFNRLSTSFGTLTDKGYCVEGTCKVFPVAPGEFGSHFKEEADLKTMNDMAQYFNNVGSAADKKHQPIKSWFYWSWNVNSGDTGGLVKDNWRDIEWKKIDYLTQIGLNPWYLGGGKPVQAKYGSLCLSTQYAEGLSQSNLKPLTIGGYTFDIKDFNTPVCEKVQVGNYTVQPSEIVIGNQKYVAEAKTVAVAEDQTATVEIVYTLVPTPIEENNGDNGNGDENGTPVDKGTYAVAVQAGTPWEENGMPTTVLNLYITNNSSEPIAVPWTIELSNDAYAAVNGAWNFKVVSTEGGKITGVTEAENAWQSLQPNGENTINVGLIVSSTSADFMPKSVTLNGQPMTISNK